MNTHNYAVVVNNTGGIPSVQSRNGNTYYEMMQHLNYEELTTGSKAECDQYLEEMVAQLNEIAYFND